MAYLDGLVELLSPSDGHESTKSMIACLIEAYCLDRDILLRPFGSWLLKNKRKQTGIEPDECYVFGPTARGRRKPDLAIEVVWTSGGIDKLAIYQRLGIDEVWFWKRGTLAVYGLGDKGYAVRARSKWIPDLDLALVCKLADVEPLNEAVKQLRAATKPR